MKVISLQNTKLDDKRDGAPNDARRWYFGCGWGRIGLDAQGCPVALVYDHPQTTWPDADELDECASVLHGMISCWEFCSD